MRNRTVGSNTNFAFGEFFIIPFCYQFIINVELEVILLYLDFYLVSFIKLIRKWKI